MQELNRGGVRYRIYKQDVAGNVGTPDEAFLPKIGRHGWILITADWRNAKWSRSATDGLQGESGSADRRIVVAAASSNVILRNHK